MNTRESLGEVNYGNAELPFALCPRPHAQGCKETKMSADATRRYKVCPLTSPLSFTRPSQTFFPYLLWAPPRHVCQFFYLHFTCFTFSFLPSAFPYLFLPTFYLYTFANLSCRLSTFFRTFCYLLLTFSYLFLNYLTGFLTFLSLSFLKDFLPVFLPFLTFSYTLSTFYFSFLSYFLLPTFYLSTCFTFSYLLSMYFPPCFPTRFPTCFEHFPVIPTIREQNIQTFYSSLSLLFRCLNIFRHTLPSFPPCRSYGFLKVSAVPPVARNRIIHP